MKMEGTSAAWMPQIKPTGVELSACKAQLCAKRNDTRLSRVAGRLAGIHGGPRNLYAEARLRGEFNKAL
jgi:hypothetical protein